MLSTVKPSKLKWGLRTEWCCVLKEGYTLATRDMVSFQGLLCARFVIYITLYEIAVPWITRRSNHSILKEISPEYSLEGLMLKLKLQYFGHLMQRTDSLEKTLMLGKIEGRRRRVRQRMRWLDDITDSMDMSFSVSW